MAVDRTKMNKIIMKESSVDENRQILPTGGKYTAVYPLSQTNRQQYTSLSTENWTYAGEDDSNVSMDFMSLSVSDDHLRDQHGNILTSASKRDIDIKHFNKWVQPPNTGGQLNYQSPHVNPQMSHTVYIKRPQVHAQDTSPHTSFEEGNSTCWGPSTSTSETQGRYRRPMDYAVPEMADYRRRLQTFDHPNWPHKHPRKEEFAKAGLFYQGECYHFNH